MLQPKFIFNYSHVGIYLINQNLESVGRIEPTQLETLPPAIADLTAELLAEARQLSAALHITIAANLAGLVRIMNTYYSNHIEGHDTRPRNIECALAGKLVDDQPRRNLQIEAAAHARIRTEIDRIVAEGRLPEPTSRDFILWLHRELYRDAPEEMLRIEGAGRMFVMEPGKWRNRPEHDVAVGRHIPPSSGRVPVFMEYFERRYHLAGMGPAMRIAAIAVAHYRFNFIHLFPDGNGRVSRLMSHAVARAAGIGAHGLWSVSRGFARVAEPEGIHAVDGRDRFAAPRRSGRPREPAAAGVDGLHRMVPEGLSRPSEVHGQSVRTENAFGTAAHLCRAPRTPQTGGRISA